jgi:hypothetical protein
MLEFLPGPKPAGLDQLKQASLDGDIGTFRAVFFYILVDRQVRLANGLFLSSYIVTTAYNNSARE